MKPPESQDPLEAWLHEQNHYVDDAGFSARVVAKLPSRRRSWLRPVILLGATSVGAVLAFRWLPWRNLPALDLSALFSLHPNVQPVLPWVLVVAVGFSLVWSIQKAIEELD